ncbi:MAG: hypothetical protein AC479_06380 [miscellaneous Crenarchaeota group-6 archaeon AD8-1]|nr:MAG: hypothetical protein AC479_06380 [miscellaneous Crenarchaeota group-6 archaeon AD8-1]
MIAETICLLFVFIAGYLLMWCMGFLQRFSLKFLDNKILNELSYLKVSAPNLKSTSDSNSSVSL